MGIFKRVSGRLTMLIMVGKGNKSYFYPNVELRYPESSSEYKHNTCLFEKASA